MYIEEGQTAMSKRKKKDKRANNNLQILHIKLKIGQQEPH